MSTIIVLAFKCLALVVITLSYGQKKMTIMSILETTFQVPTSHFQKTFLKTKLKRVVRL